MQWLAQLFSRRRRYEDISISIQEHIEERVGTPVAAMTREQLRDLLRPYFSHPTGGDPHAPGDARPTR